MTTPRRALVTGAGVRVGRAIALALGNAGYDVALHYHHSADAAEAAAGEIQALGRHAHALAADLRVPNACAQLVRAAEARLGGLELLVVNAAEFVRTPYDSVDEASWNSAIELNLSSALWLSKAATSALRAARGAIVFVTCSSASVPFRNYLPYVVAKGGLQQLMKTLALELAPEVRVNAVAPGTVLPPEDMAPEHTQRLVRGVPLARVGSAQDVADAVVYLASAKYVTGEEIRVDGGRALARFERFE